MFFCHTPLIISTVFGVCDLYALKKITEKKKTGNLKGCSFQIFYTVAIWIYREISGEVVTNLA